MATFTTAGRILGGKSIDRATLRARLPHARWLLYAAGLVNAGDTNIATLTLRYVKNDGTTVPIGSVTHNANTLVKKAMGPFDLFATAGVPGENIVTVELFGQKNAGADGTARDWTLWTRYLPSRQ